MANESHEEDIWANETLLLADEDEAIYSGYYVDWEYFQILVRALRPEFFEGAAKIGQRVGFYDFLSLYDGWRSDLLAEDDSEIQVPQLLLSITDEDNHAPGDIEPDRTRYFFWTRFIKAEVDTCIEDYPLAMVEGEMDIAQRDEMIALIKRRHDFEVDISSLHFGCFLDDHPNVHGLRYQLR